jgi:hypothetical protein
VLLAGAVAVLHAAVVLFTLTGALLAWREPRLVWLHAPVALVVLAVNLAGAPCPLTTLELTLRQRAGLPPYDDGFLGHVLFGPLGLDVAATSTQVGTYTVALGLNALGYGVLLARGLRSPGRPVPLHRAHGGNGAPAHTLRTWATRRSAPARGRRRCGPRRRTRGPPGAAPRAGRRTS